MNTIELTITSDDGYTMNWKLECTEDEQDQLAEHIQSLVEDIKGRYRE